MRITQEKRLTFNDGIARICTVGNIAPPGDKPQEGLTGRLRLCFGYETIGVRRHYAAMQGRVQLSELIRVPLHRDISVLDVCVIGDVQYRIRQVQHIGDTRPPHTKLSLERTDPYDIA